MQNWLCWSLESSRKFQAQYDPTLLEPLPLYQLRTFDPKTSFSLLTTVPCSLASLNQRSGRAGRTSPGKTFRLFPSSALSTLPRSTVPEICRSDISLFVLQLKALGIENVLRGFDFMTGPPSEMLGRALEFLSALKAVSLHHIA